jgi:hypothetical protein
MNWWIHNEHWTHRGLVWRTLKYIKRKQKYITDNNLTLHCLLKCWRVLCSRRLIATVSLPARTSRAYLWLNRSDIPCDILIFHDAFLMRRVVSVLIVRVSKQYPQLNLMLDLFQVYGVAWTTVSLVSVLLFTPLILFPFKGKHFSVVCCCWRIQGILLQNCNSCRT